MKKITVALAASALLASHAGFANAQEDISSTCAPWAPTVSIDKGKIEKLGKKLEKEKSDKGPEYSQDRIVYLMATDSEKAKSILADTRDTVAKTKTGQVDLQGADLQGFDLSGYNLDNVDLKGAELTGANLSGTSLKGAYLYKADMTGANLNDADLSFAYLGSSELTNASLCNANLSNAAMEDIEMAGAYFKGAKLDGAKNLPVYFYTYSSAIIHDGLVIQKFK